MKYAFKNDELCIKNEGFVLIMTNLLLKMMHFPANATAPYTWEDPKGIGTNVDSLLKCLDFELKCLDFLLKLLGFLLKMLDFVSKMLDFAARAAEAAVALARVEAEEYNIAPGKIFLGGFDQGGVVALAAALTAAADGPDPFTVGGVSTNDKSLN